jgi:hypothetical protein
MHYDDITVVRNAIIEWQVFYNGISRVTKSG